MATKGAGYGGTGVAGQMVDRVVGWGLIVSAARAPPGVVVGGAVARGEGTLVIAKKAAGYLLIVVQ